VLAFGRSGGPFSLSVRARNAAELVSDVVTRSCARLRRPRRLRSAGRGRRLRWQRRLAVELLALLVLLTLLLVPRGLAW
jgi:hypothetical protein